MLGLRHRLPGDPTAPPSYQNSHSPSPPTIKMLGLRTASALFRSTGTGTLLRPLRRISFLSSLRLPSSPLLRSTAAVRASHRKVSYLSTDDLVYDRHQNERCEELGGFALKVALTNHFTAAYPDANHALLTALRDVTLSRENLSRVAESLDSKGLILLMKVKENGVDYIKKCWNGFRLGMDDYGIGVAGTFDKDDMHNMWEDTIRKLIENEPHGEDVDVSIKRLGLKEFGKGYRPFRAGMHNYARQAAGIMYVESKYNMQTFWKKYKDFLEPMVTPDNLENQQSAARAFEVEMKYVIEADPHYHTAFIKDPDYD